MGNIHNRARPSLRPERVPLACSRFASVACLPGSRHIVLSTPIKVDELESLLDIVICTEKNTVRSNPSRSVREHSAVRVERRCNP